MGQTAGPDMAVVLSVTVKSPVVRFGPGSLPHMSKTTTGQHGAFSGLAACLKAGKRASDWLIMGKKSMRPEGAVPTV